MATGYGKKFEQEFSDDFQRTFIDGTIYRLHDQVNGYGGLIGSNPCDFIGYVYPFFFMLECKVTEQNTLPLSNIRQLDYLLSFSGRKGVEPDLIIWFKKHDKVACVPIDEVARIRKSGAKSINVKMIDNGEYKVYNVPSEKKRAFLSSNYRILYELAEAHLERFTQQNIIKEE